MLDDAKSRGGQVQLRENPVRVAPPLFGEQCADGSALLVITVTVLHGHGGDRKRLGLTSVSVSQTDQPSPGTAAASAWEERPARGSRVRLVMPRCGGAVLSVGSVFGCRQRASRDANGVLGQRETHERADQDGQ